MKKMVEKRNVYVGHRYVPKIMGEWNKQETYEGLSIVTYKGASYTSKKRVPVGIDISNEEYWVVTGNYNAQIDQYREDVKKQKENLENFKEETNRHLTQKANVFETTSEMINSDLIGVNTYAYVLNNGSEKNRVFYITTKKSYHDLLPNNMYHINSTKQLVALEILPDVKKTSASIMVRYKNEDQLLSSIELLFMIGIKKIIICLYVENGVILDDKMIIQNIIDLAKKRGIDCSTFKIHSKDDLTTSVNQKNYTDSINSYITNHKTDIETLYVFNERADIVTVKTNNTFIASVVNTIKNKGIRVGITLQHIDYYYDLFYNNKPILDMLDVLGYNAYPSISNADNRSHIKSVYSWERLIKSLMGFKELTKKPMALTEVGTGLYWDNLMYPTALISDMKSATYGGADVSELFIYGLISNDNVKDFEDISYWALDNTLRDFRNNYDFYKLNSVLSGGK